MDVAYNGYAAMALGVAVGILRLTVTLIETIERAVGLIVGNQDGVLIVACQVIVGQTTQEQSLTGNVLQLFGNG